MYDFIFHSKMVTTVAGLALLVLASTLAARPSFWWRTLAFNSGPAIAAGFLAAILLSDQRFSISDVLAALMFEFIILCAFCRTTYLAYHAAHQLDLAAATRAVRLSLPLYIVTLVPALLGGGFGIFSSGTRIDYLYESSSAKYLTYLGLMMVILLGGLLARRITINGKPQLLDYAVVLIVSAASIVAGSKGGFVLWIGAVMAFIDYHQARIRPLTIILAGGVVAVLVAGLAVIVSDFLRISIPEFFDLAFNRFYISNDARALAFDLRTLEVHPGVSIWGESFRSLSSLFGNPPRNTSIGVELYDSYFGPSGGAGANGSFVALAILYTAPGDAALPLLIASLAVGLLLFLIRLGVRHMPTALSRFTVQMIATLNVVLLSQDFLAFQVVLPMSVVLALLLYLSGSFHVLVPQRG